MNHTTFVVIAIVAALALVGIVAVTIVTIPLQQAEAKGVCGTQGLFNSAIHSGNQSLISCLPR